ncbi:MAG: hypothetical protein LBU88_01535 [Treponema sp.]|jgi:hypothetical protein|nr:hypothetical protein [Treponema sp.]
MSNENNETTIQTTETLKSETPERINLATPRPSDTKVLNNSLTGRTFIQLSDTEKNEE